MLENLKKNEMRILLLLVLLGFSIRLIGSILFPLWSGPDEPAHFVYIKMIGETGQLPNIKQSDEVLKSVYNETVHQPPLYYAAMAPIYAAVANQSEFFIVHLLRLFSVILGTACIAATYFIAKKLSLNSTVRLGSAAFIALLPTHVIVSSFITSGPLAWLFSLATVYFAICTIESKKAIHMALTGLFLAAATLTRFTAMSVAVAFLIAAIIFIMKGKGSSLKRIAVCAIPLAAIPAFLRNLQICGSIIPSDIKAPIELDLNWLVHYTTRIFAGVWLQEYGAATIPDYRILFFLFYSAVSLAAFIGIIALLLGNEWDTRKKMLIASALLLPVLLNFAGVTYINTNAIFFDGKLLFDTIAFAAILFMLGQGAFLKLIRQENKSRAFILLILATMLCLDIIVLVNYNHALPKVNWPVF